MSLVRTFFPSSQPPYINLKPARPPPAAYQHPLNNLSLLRIIAPKMIRTSSPLRTRRLRCQRCSEKKFRTTQDLALHVLSKHAKLQLPPTPADDSRSITLNSPMLPGEAEELDQLLGSALRESFVGNRVNNFKPHVEERSASELKTTDTTKRPRRQATTESHKKRAKAARSETTTTESCQSPQAPAPRCGAPDRAFGTEIQPSSRVGEVYNPVPGESIGPCAQDVFLAQCRSGQISLVPTLMKQTTTLNFANALF